MTAPLLHLPLFPDAESTDSAAPSLPRQAELHQWFTPAWAAEEIVQQKFSWLRAGHRGIEPSCGDGAFLRIPVLMDTQFGDVVRQFGATTAPTTSSNCG